MVKREISVRTCMKCGGDMVVENSRTFGKDGRKVRYYRCKQCKARAKTVEINYELIDAVTESIGFIMDAMDGNISRCEMSNFWENDS